MYLQDLISVLPDACVDRIDTVEIRAITYDSRKVQPGSLFVAMKGFHVDGHKFIPQALERGAVAVIYEDTAYQHLLDMISTIYVPNARTALAPLAAAFYGHPGQAMRVVGITGTDGKTTTTFLTSVALEAGGYTTGLMGTVDFKIAGRQWANDTRQSTPEAVEVQALLREMADMHCGYAVLEATSHALSASWNRLGGSGFDIALLTNVTQEHLDFHGTVEQYRRDKARLFEMLGETAAGVTSAQNKQRKIAIVNADDPNHRMFLDAAPSSAQQLTYAIHNPADLRAFDVQSTRDGLRFRVSTPWGEAPLHLQLTGDFNVANVLAALSVALVEGVPLEAAIAALEGVPGVRGRMERIDCGQPFTVLVDYAHTPGSFEKLLSIVRPLTEQKLIAVFGSAGERDRDKRPLQGAIAARFCDFLVLTDEDPRLEDRQAIIDEIAVGVEQEGKREGADYIRVPDRATAIRTAFEQAESGDIVLLLGKGHEGSIIYGQENTRWNEVGEAHAALAELGYNG